MLTGAGFGSEALQQLVLIVADGRFHEKAALQRAVREVPPAVCGTPLLVDVTSVRIRESARSWMQPYCSTLVTPRLCRKHAHPYRHALCEARKCTMANRRLSGGAC